MIRFSLYDFDRTIYSHDTGIKVLFTVFRRDFRAYFFLPKIALAFVLLAFKIISKKKFKEWIFSPISLYTTEELSSILNEFWAKESTNLFPQVLKQIQQDRAEGYIVGIVTASMDLLVAPVSQYFDFDFLIGTKIQINNNHLTSQIIGENCKNQEKVTRVEQYIVSHYPDQDYIVQKMYSDSLHDLPLLEYAQEAYTVEADGTIRSGLPKPNKNI